MSNRRSSPPNHPGKMLREQVLQARSIKVAEAARQLGVSRVTLSRVVHESAAISVDLARRLEVWLGTPSASAWLYAQSDWDLWQADQCGPPEGVSLCKDAGGWVRAASG